jgi:hypothetical protein
MIFFGFDLQRVGSNYTEMAKASYRYIFYAWKYLPVEPIRIFIGNVNEIASFVFGIETYMYPNQYNGSHYKST